MYSNGALWRDTMIDRIRSAPQFLFILAMAAAPASAFAQQRASGRAETKPVAAPAGDAAAEGKLDVSDLEKKYWAAKDTDFSVVQNRAYSKAGRFAATLQYGSYINDPYSDVNQYRFAANYYFSERYGVEVSYAMLDSVNSKSTNGYINSNGGVFPNHNKDKQYYGAAFNWIPIYAKMSLLNSRIVYFDMAFSPGVGMTTYEQQVMGSNPTASAATLSFDVTQHFFLSNWFALRLDYQNRWYNEDIKDYRHGAGMGSDVNHEGILSIGTQFFF